MSDREILEQAIQKAIDGGFDAELKDGWVACGNQHTRTDGAAPKDIIYSHQFAKALWGEKLLRITTRVDTFDGSHIEDARLTSWQYHLQRMVISDNPIKYLENNL